MNVYRLLESERAAIEDALRYCSDPIDGDELVEQALEIISGLKKEVINVEELFDAAK